MITLSPVRNLYPGYKVYAISSAWKAGFGWDVFHYPGSEVELISKVEELKSLGYSKVQLQLFKVDRNWPPVISDFSIEELSNTTNKL